jgi:hypothetical protein
MWFDTLQLGTPENPMQATGFGNGCFAISNETNRHFNKIIVYAADKTKAPYNSQTAILT